MARSVPKFQLSEMLESLSKGDLTAPTRGQPITRSADAGSSKIIPSKTITVLALGSGVEASPVKNPWVGTSQTAPAPAGNFYIEVLVRAPGDESVRQ